MDLDAGDAEQRALRALRAIDDGADIGAEALKLSNEFTDRHTARLSAWVRRLRRRSDEV